MIYKRERARTATVDTKNDFIVKDRVTTKTYLFGIKYKEITESNDHSRTEEPFIDKNKGLGFKPNK